MTFVISMEKQCGDCGGVFHVTKFDEVPDNRDGYSTRCTVCQRPRNKKRRKEYYATLKGHLGRVFNGMNQRCNNPKIHNYSRYGGRGIQNKFVPPDEFRNYVIDELGITCIEQIKGLHIHRIDNDGHYEIGNIKFLTPDEHKAVHIQR